MYSLKHDIYVALSREVTKLWQLLETDWELHVVRANMPLRRYCECDVALGLDINEQTQASFSQ